MTNTGIGFHASLRFLIFVLMSTEKDLIHQNAQYQLVSKAIAYIAENFRSQPDLEKIAEIAGLSPLHFQKVFSAWAGVSPKQFLHYVSANHAKSLLRNQQMNLFDAAYETGLSGTGRLHDLFIKIEGMSPGNFRDAGKNLNIRFSFTDSPFGQVITASTERGICHMAFEEDQEMAFEKLKERYPAASFAEDTDIFHIQARQFFEDDWTAHPQLRLHLRGTPFQLKVWEALLQIPMGKLSSYGAIAQSIGQPGASRAVGTAIGSNPVAFLIPCHRVIQTSGVFGGYMWGKARKTAMIGWEMAKRGTEII